MDTKAIISGLAINDLETENNDNEQVKHEIVKPSEIYFFY
jgi:hypothetical protein